MNQRSPALASTMDQVAKLKADRSSSLMKSLLFQVLAQAEEGHLVWKEQGEIIAEFGRSEHTDLTAELDVLDARFYARALLGGSSGAGEAFVDSWWQTPSVTEVTRFFARNLDVLDKWENRFGWLMKPIEWLRLLSRANTRTQAKRNILAHYDLGNPLYESFLDERMQYSSALFSTAEESLAQAQLNKLDRLCQQLQLCEQDHLLEIGTGWGGLAIHAARHYGCKVTTTTISDAQYNYAKGAIAQAGLTDKVELLNQDYRTLEGQYDKLVSVEMIEAVGKRFLPDFFRKINQLLKPNGLLMLQAITIADQRYESYSRGEDFIQKHIFPGGFLPSVAAMTGIIAGRTELIVRDIHDMGIDYAYTLSAWRDNLLAKPEELAALEYDERFMKLWTYYFGYCEGGFLERRTSAVQLLASKAPHAGA